jgi:ribosomal protein S3
MCYKGFAVKIQGRLKGKLRAKSSSFTAGKVSQQTINNKSEYYQTFARTIYGCFGIRI